MENIHNKKIILYLMILLNISLIFSQGLPNLQPEATSSSGGGNVSSVTSSTNCITVNPTTGDVELTFNESCGGGGGGNQFWNLSGSNLFPESLNYNVGIGTDNPNYTLHVISPDLNEGLAISRDNRYNFILDGANIWFNDSAGFSVGSFGTPDGSDDAFAFYTAGLARMYVYNDGKIGIGTNSSNIDKDFTVIGDGNITGDFYAGNELVNTWLYNQTTPAIEFANTNILGNVSLSNLQSILNSTGIYSTFNSTYDEKNSSVFLLNGANAYYNGGDVGIGTDSPGATLEVEGSLLIDKGTAEWLFRDRSIALGIQHQTSGVSSIIEQVSKDGDGTDIVGYSLYGYSPSFPTVTNRERLYLHWDGSSQYNIQSEAGGDGTVRPLALYTGSNSNQLYLNTEGNVGIGTDSPSTKLEVNGNFGTATTGLASTNSSGGVTISIGVTMPDTSYGVFLTPSTNTDFTLAGGLPPGCFELSSSRTTTTFQARCQYYTGASFSNWEGGVFWTVIDY